MFETPILFIIFNRTDTTPVVFQQIKQIRPKYLFIAADGARVNVEGEQEKCEEVKKQILDSIDWECDLKTLFQKENLGCGKGPATAISWFFSHVEQGIILEDDCLPDLSFFNYCSVLLDKYKLNEKIIAINGCNFGYESTHHASYSFSRYMNVWGWASWGERLKYIDYDISSWDKKRNKLFFLYWRLKQGFFEFDLDWYRYWLGIFDDLKNHSKDIWDYHWIYAQISNKQLSIIPSKNLISNIGFREDATHTTLLTHPAANLKSNPITSNIIHPTRIGVNKIYEELFVKNVCYMYIRKSGIFYVKKYLSNWSFYRFLKKTLK